MEYTLLDYLENKNHGSVTQWLITEHHIAHGYNSQFEVSPCEIIQFKSTWGKRYQIWNIYLIYPGIT